MFFFIKSVLLRKEYAIKTRSWFEATLAYNVCFIKIRSKHSSYTKNFYETEVKPGILSFKKVSCNTSRSAA